MAGTTRSGKKDNERNQGSQSNQSQRSNRQHNNRGQNLTNEDRRRGGENSHSGSRRQQ